MPRKAQINHSEFLRLLANSEQIVRSYLRSQIQDYHHMSEIMQNVFIVGWKKFPKFSGTEDEFTKWLCVIGRFEALKHRQSLARDRLVLGEKLINLIADEGDQEILLHEQWSEKLELCMKELPATHRDFVKEAYSPEVSIKDLAAKMNKTPASLYQKLSRIRKTLATCMGKLADQPA